MENKTKVEKSGAVVNTQIHEKSNKDPPDPPGAEKAPGDSDDKKPGIQCNICGAKLKNYAGLAQHKKVVHGRVKGVTVHCEICGEKKPNRAAVEQHKMVAHGILDGIRCDICGFNLDDMECYERHQQTVHRIDTRMPRMTRWDTDPNDRMGPFPAVNFGAPQAVCRIPDYGDRTRPAPLDTRMPCMTGWDTDPNDRMGPVPVRCDICGFKVRCTADVLQHKKIVHGFTSVAICDVCGARLANPEGLEQHKKAVHNILTPLPCPICGEVQTDRSTLRIHKEKVHRYKKEMRCEVCQEVFTDRPSFRKHQETAHAGENVRMHYLGHYDAVGSHKINPPVSEPNASIPQRSGVPVKTEEGCDICGSIFPDPTALDKHKETVHSDKLDPCVFCDICGAALPDITGVAKHKEMMHNEHDPAAKRGRYDEVTEPPNPTYNKPPSATVTLPLPSDLIYLVSDEPSNTIVVGELPSGCRERDLTILFSRYGVVDSVALVCNERVALVKYNDISFPTRLVQMAKTNPFFVGTTHVYLGFSSTSARAMTPASQQQQPLSVDKNPPSKILHLDISAVQYPITVDVIKAICAPHGQVNRIFIGKKNLDHSLEALTEFNSVDEAKVAKEQLNGADIYSGCCTLSVTFSRLQRVRVVKNDSESWDFTGTVSSPTNVSSQRILLGHNGVVTPTSKQAEPSTRPVPVQPPLVQTTAVPQTICMPPIPHMIPFCPPQALPPGYGLPMSMFPPGHVPQMRPMTVYPATPMPTQPLGYPPTMPAQILPTSSSSTVATPQAYTTPPPIFLAATGAGQLPVPVGGDSLSGVAASGRLSDTPVFDCMEGVVLIVNNVPPNLNCDNLFNLLCLYGNIARIKFLKSKAGCALIQMGSVEASDLIYRYYDGVTIFGQTIRFCHSKQTELQEQNSLDTLNDGTPVMKNYSSDLLNRFRNAATKSNILEPSRTLYFYNAPPDVKPDEVCRIFSDCGSKVPPRVLIFAGKGSQNTSIGLVEWDTLSEALEALILANHRPITVPGSSSPVFFKLAFSTKSVSEGRPGPV